MRSPTSPREHTGAGAKPPEPLPASLAKRSIAKTKATSAAAARSSQSPPKRASSSAARLSPPSSPTPDLPAEEITPADEERLVRRIHARMGGQVRLRGVLDPTAVRRIVLDALAADQTAPREAVRVRRNQLTVLERRAVRTVTNRGAAVRSRQRQRNNLAGLRAALLEKDAQLAALRRALGTVQAVMADVALPDLTGAAEKAVPDAAGLASAVAGPSRTAEESLPNTQTPPSPLPLPSQEEAGSSWLLSPGGASLSPSPTLDAPGTPATPETPAAQTRKAPPVAFLKPPTATPPMLRMVPSVVSSDMAEDESAAAALAEQEQTDNQTDNHTGNQDALEQMLNCFNDFDYDASPVMSIDGTDGENGDIDIEDETARHQDATPGDAHSISSLLGL